MATLNYKLRTGGKTSTIQLIFNYGKNKRLRYSTGLKIRNANNWNEKNQKVKNVIDEVNKLAINNKLNDIKTFLEKLHAKLTIEDKINVTNEILTNELNIFLNRNVKPQKENEKYLDLIPFFEWFLTHYEKNPLPTTKKPISKGTLKTYRNAFKMISKFNDEVYLLNYDKITLDFYDDFLKFMYKKNYSTNYMGVQIRVLKTIMNLSFEKGFHKSTDFKKRYFAKLSEEINNIYLTQTELLKIYNLDFTNYKPKRLNKYLQFNKTNLENCRDLFLIGANTGLRISDFNKLTKKNIIEVNGSNYINIVSQKTNKRLTIPVNPMVNAILKKRKGTPPKSMPDQHINYIIKEIGELAKIDSNETKTITKGGKKVIYNLKKFELISSHTARRSFCTNAYKSGMPTIDIMAISGHKTEKVFYNYIKVNDIERAEKIKKHKFFTNNNLKVV